MNDCLTSLYIPDLQELFINNGVTETSALLRINTSLHNVTSVDLYLRGERLIFIILLKNTTTIEEHTSLIKSLCVSVTGSSGREYRLCYKQEPGIQLPFWLGCGNDYWKPLFEQHSRMFTPFELVPTKVISCAITSVRRADINDIITALFIIIGLIRDDVDTKPARAS